MLKLDDISICYGSKLVVEDFSLSLKKGEILSIIGESGSGKTSVIKAILGLLAQNGKIIKGDIFYKENSLLGISEKEMNKIRGEEIALVFQDAGLSLNPLRKIGTQFIQYIQSHTRVSKKEATVLAEKMLEKMKLNKGIDIMNSYTFNLSGGMKQRVGIAMAMALKPNLLLLDEPTSALDLTTQAQVIEEILNLNKEYNTSILMISHNIPLGIYMSDKIIVMKKGKIIEEGLASEILNNPKHIYTKELLANIPETCHLNG